MGDLANIKKKLDPVKDSDLIRMIDEKLGIPSEEREPADVEFLDEEPSGPSFKAIGKLSEEGRQIREFKKKRGIEDDKLMQAFKTLSLEEQKKIIEQLPAYQNADEGLKSKGGAKVVITAEEFRKLPLDEQKRIAEKLPSWGKRFKGTLTGGRGRE